ncbi:MAG: DUF2948 family protein [Sphingomonadales bacterium]
MTITSPDMGGLKLRAFEADDLTVISACLQDAVLTVGDMAYLPRERRFALIVNRFVWESAPDPDQPEGEACLRVRTGIHFDDVLNVSVIGIPQKSRTRVLELLAVEAFPEDETRAAIGLLFAGGGIVRLDVDCINAHLTDVSPPWPARCKPCHNALDGDT